jgi:peptidoglycan/xylan/chitin deacetylase (PgdA/CDA1 family)
MTGGVDTSVRGGRERRGRVLRQAAKWAVLPAGVVGRRRAQDVVMLGYHRVGTDGAEIDVSATTFGTHLDLLASDGAVRSLDDALASGGCVVLSFDDGTRDFTDRVVPMLVARGLPAILYLATAMAEDPGPLGLGPGVSWNGLRDAVSTGLVSIGSHTHSHANLAHATEDAAADEMRRSKDLIEDRLGMPCRHFAYPWGVGSAGADRAARRLFASAALDGWRTNRWAALDPHRLGRTPILRSDGVTFFRLKVKGMLDPERYLYQAARRGPWGKS